MLSSTSLGRGRLRRGSRTSAIISRDISRFRIRRGDRESGKKRIHGSARTSFRHFALRSSGARAGDQERNSGGGHAIGPGIHRPSGSLRPDWGPHRASDSPEVLQQVRQTASLRAALPGTASRLSLHPGLGCPRKRPALLLHERQTHIIGRCRRIFCGQSSTQGFRRASDQTFDNPGTRRTGRHQTTAIHSRGRRPS